MLPLIALFCSDLLPTLESCSKQPLVCFPIVRLATTTWSSKSPRTAPWPRSWLTMRQRTNTEGVSKRPRTGIGMSLKASVCRSVNRSLPSWRRRVSRTPAVGVLRSHRLCLVNRRRLSPRWWHLVSMPRRETNPFVAHRLCMPRAALMF